MKKFIFIWLGLVGLKAGLVTALQAQEVPVYVEAERARARTIRHAPAGAPTGNYDLTYARMHWQVDPRLDSIAGCITYYFRLTENASALYFDMDEASLTVDSVRWQGQLLPAEARDGALRVDLPEEWPAGRYDSLSICYHGRPRSEGFGSFTASTHAGVPVLWTLSEPYGAKTWWPTKQDLTDKIDSIDVYLAYPDSIDGHAMTGVSNGILVEQRTEDGLQISHWRHRHPIPAYLVALAVTDYTRIDMEAGTYHPFPVQNFVYPENHSAAAQSLAVIPALFEVYESLFGPYPFYDEKYGHAQFNWGGGMEHTTITFVSGFSRGLLAHELAHHWFGDDITCGSWSDIWINEGFATYAEALTREHLDGETAFTNWRKYALRGINLRPHASVYKAGADTADVGTLFDWYSTYLKGAMVLHMLRFRLGDSTFFAGLRNFLDTYGWHFARTDDFRQIMEETSGEDLSEFFADWVYGKGFPAYTVDWQSLDNGMVKVDLWQDPSDESVDFFETPITVRMKGAEGQTRDTTVFHRSNGQSFWLDAGFPVTQLEINPDAHIITGPVEYMALPSFKWKRPLMTVPNPVKDTWMIYVQNPATVRRIRLYDLHGRLVRDRLRPFCPIDTRGLSTGLYLLVVETGGGIYTWKLLKE